MYRPPHMFTPPPPPPSSFMSPYPSFTPVGEAPLPPLPASPPPLPPSSPPPPPPPPPPPATTCSPEVPDVEEELEHPTSPPPRPDDEVVHTIEEFCRLIADNGAEFENFATKKEAENPDFAFLFGGPPGSAEAIGHEYYQWMKRNYKFVEKSQNDVHDGLRTGDKDGASQSSDPEDEETAASPAVSDMDMEDDVTPDGDSGFDNVTELSTREPISVSNKTDSVKEPSHVLRSTAEKLVLSPGNVSEDDVNPNGHWGIDAVRNRSARDIVPVRHNMDAGPLHESGSTMELVQEVAVSGALTYPDSLPLLQDGRGDKGSAFTEEDIVHQPAVTSLSDSNIQQASLVIDGGKVEHISRVFVKDRSPFRLIQGYVSDESDEDIKMETVEDITTGRDLSKADDNVELEKASLTEVGQNVSTGLGQATSVVLEEAELLSDASQKTSVSPSIVCPSRFDPSDDTAGTSEGLQSIKIVNQVKKLNVEEDVQVTAKPDVDEFGRLVRKGSSDSDSDGRVDIQSGKRGRSLSRSRSPHGNKWRRTSRSPRGRGKRSTSPRSPGPSSRSPPASRRINAFARRDRDQPPECFNFLRGRCFRGPSCRFVHNEFGRQGSRQQQYQEYLQDRENHDVHVDGPVSGDISIDKKMDIKECNDIPQKEDNSSEMQASKNLSETSIKTSSDGILGEKDASHSVLEGAEPPVNQEVGEIEVTDQISKEVIPQVQGPQVENVVKTSELPAEEEVKSVPLPESFQLGQAESLPIQSAEKSQTLPDAMSVQQTNSSREAYFQLTQPSSVSTSTPEQSQNVTQFTRTEDDMQAVQANQATSIQNQMPEGQPYPSQAPISAVYPDQTQPFSNNAPIQPPSDQSMPPREFPQPSLLASGPSLLPSQLLPPGPNGQPPPSYPGANTSSFSMQNSSEFLPPPVPSHQPQHPHSHTFPSHGPITGDYNPSKAHPPNPVWSNLPPPPPRPQNVSSGPGWPSFPLSDPSLPQFQQNALLPRSDFNPAMRSIPPGELHRVQVPDLRRFSSMETQHPLHIDEFKQMSLPVRNQQDQPFARDGRYLQPPMTGPDSQRDFHMHHQPFIREDVRTPLPGNGFGHPQSLPFPREQLPNRPYSFSEDNLPPRFLPREQFQNMHDFQRQPQFGHQQPTNSNVSLNYHTPGMVDAPITRYSSSFLESNLAPHPSGLPKIPISSHYNPYASTFEQTPASFKFGPSVPGRENDASFINRYEPGHVSVGETASRITASPPNYSKSTEQFMPRTGVNPPDAPAEVLPMIQKQTVKDSASGDAYDPLFDSIEPSSKIFNKEDNAKENVDILVGENSKQKEVMTVEPKSEADELGEVATDAEVGAVENGSPILVDGKDWSPPGVPADLINAAVGEIEIDQVRSPGKSKKTKDSRSMKLFKIALAEFVKEVLKPSWRQGNMSKEAFKTIVKKTVEKVSGGMPSHQVPKSQAKINQYVESSQRKLTKLVMGYVDKYVKA